MYIIITFIIIIIIIIVRKVSTVQHCHPPRSRIEIAPVDDVRVDAEQAREDVGAEGARELALVLDDVSEAAL